MTIRVRTSGVAAQASTAATPEVRTRMVVSSAMQRSLTSKRLPVPQGKDFMVHDNRVRELAQNYRKMETLTKEAVQVNHELPCP